MRFGGSPLRLLEMAIDGGLVVFLSCEVPANATK